MDFGMMMLVMLGIMGVQIFFGVKRQKQKAQEIQNMMDSLVPGANVVTIGGLHGVVAEVNDGTVVIDCEGVYLTFDRRAIARVSAAQSTQVTDLYPQEDVETIEVLEDDSDVE